MVASIGCDFAAALGRRRGEQSHGALTGCVSRPATFAIRDLQPLGPPFRKRCKQSVIAGAHFQSMTNTPAPAITTSDSWAEVRASDRVMRYRRSGAGPTLVLLGADTGPSPLSTEMVAALGERFRVIVPEVPAGASVSNFVPEFLEGLGTCHVSLIAANHLCMAAIELAFRGIDQIRRLVLIPDAEPDDSTAERAITTALGNPPIPALIVRPGLTVTDTIPLVTTFLVGA